jgi:plasmid stabilization system protein ParE
MARVIVSDTARADLRLILSELYARAGYEVASKFAEKFKDVYRNSELIGRGA